MEELLDICANEMIVNNMSGLQSYLNEARDHNIVKNKEGKDKNEYIFINYKDNILSKLAKGDFGVLVD